MIHQVVDKSRYKIPVFSDPRLHELTWYATEDDAVLGVVILDMVDLGYSWIALTQSDQPPGYTATDMGSCCLQRMMRQQHCTTPCGRTAGDGAKGMRAGLPYIRGRPARWAAAAAQQAVSSLLKGRGPAQGY